MVVAIDGPGGVGKSTVSRAVAAALDLPYLDTGSTYRAATFAVLSDEVDIHDEEAILAVLDQHTIDYDERGILLDGMLIDRDVRSTPVTQTVSAVSAHPGVRAEIVALQQDWVAQHEGSAVVEGRDIGTVVFPNAPVKVFLTARPEVRAQRRAGDAEASGSSVGDIAKDLERRDTADAGRATSPMRPADDATIIDTSDLDINGVVEAILDLVAKAGSHAEQ